MELTIQPSRYAPQGRVDLEAVTRGVVPVVGLRGLCEEIVDGFNGVMVLPGDPDETAEKIWNWEKRAGVPQSVYTYVVDG